MSGWQLDVATHTVSGGSQAGAGAPEHARPWPPRPLATGRGEIEGKNTRESSSAHPIAAGPEHPQAHRGPAGRALARPAVQAGDATPSAASRPSSAPPRRPGCGRPREPSTPGCSALTHHSFQAPTPCVTRPSGGSSLSFTGQALTGHAPPPATVLCPEEAPRGPCLFTEPAGRPTPEPAPQGPGLGGGRDGSRGCELGSQVGGQGAPGRGS